MSKTKRKRYTGAFKAKVGLEALMGIKTVGQIARDYEVHPVQVTQWKGVIRDHLPELFETPPAAIQDNEQLMVRVHAFTLSLMRAGTLADTLSRVVATLTEDFHTDLVRLCLHHPVADIHADWLKIAARD